MRRKETLLELALRVFPLPAKRVEVLAVLHGIMMMMMMMAMMMIMMMMRMIMMTMVIYIT